MIISHKFKVVYFRVPKTASSTVELMLRLNGAISDIDVCTSEMSVSLTNKNIPDRVLAELETGSGELQHMRPIDAVNFGLLTEQQLKEYQCYATLRSPLDRWRSILGHAGINDLDSALEALKTDRHFGVIERPQYDYFSYKDKLICKPLLFKNINEELRRFAKLFDIDLPHEIPVINKNSLLNKMAPLRDYVPDELKNKFMGRFANDVRLYKKFAK